MAKKEKKKIKKGDKKKESVNKDCCRQKSKGSKISKVKKLIALSKKKKIKVKKKKIKKK